MLASIDQAGALGILYFETLHDARRAARDTIIFDVCARWQHAGTQRTQPATSI